MDNLIKQIASRPTDAEGRVGLKSFYSDKNFITLQAGIQDRNYHLDLPGLVTDPGLSVAGLDVIWGDFICFAPGGILCNVPSGSAELLPADPSVARIDILTVDPVVQYDADGEIEYSGAVGALAGLTIYETPMMPGTATISAVTTWFFEIVVIVGTPLSSAFAPLGIWIMFGVIPAKIDEPSTLKSTVT
ncbi:unnamed protein product [marine sediment metagenome]|uniref:Uncharacterized protein n=1 Tax=marine sediment metagenome TaxID=412755 RepID=X1STK4_9ZZZZ